MNFLSCSCLSVCLFDYSVRQHNFRSISMSVWILRCHYYKQNRTTMRVLIAPIFQNGVKMLKSWKTKILLINTSIRCLKRKKNIYDTKQKFSVQSWGDNVRTIAGGGHLSAEVTNHWNECLGKAERTFLHWGSKLEPVWATVFYISFIYCSQSKFIAVRFDPHQ